MVENILRLLSDLVKVPSVCGQEGAIAHFIADWLEKNNLAVEVVDVKPNRPNVVVTMNGEEAGPNVLLNGHMDTVEVGGDWVQDPFGAQVEEGRMYGRGTLDMKGGLACILWVAAALREENLPRRGKLLVTAVVDEEAIARGTYALVQSGVTRDMDFAMIPEPTGLKVVTGHCGRAVFDVQVRGRVAHSSRPEDGVNAIEKAATLVNTLRQIRSPSHPKIKSTTINALRIEGGQRDVMLVPDRCSLLLDQCLVPGYTIETALENLRHKISELGVDAEAKLPARETPFCEPFDLPENEPHVQLIMEAATRILEKNPEIGFHDGPCDSCILVNQGRIPTIEFGPSGSGLHQADEYVQLESVKKTAAVYYSIMRMCFS